MADLHLIGGEKGGVGKSFVCRTLLQYYLDEAKPFSAFDSDRSNPDVLRLYGDACEMGVAIFSEAQRLEDAANQLYNAAIEETVLVNLPAQAFIPVTQWFQNNELLAIAQEDGVKFYQWFVSDGGYDSLKLFRRSVEHFEGQVSHIFVKNWGQCDDWEPLETNEALNTLIKKYKVKIIDFPKFIGNADRNRIDDLSLSFGQAREYKEFGSISRQRVKRFLREAYGAFDSLGIL